MITSKQTRSFFTALLLSIVFVTTTYADVYKNDDTSVEDNAVGKLQFVNPWARPSMSSGKSLNSNSAIFLEIKNNTDQAYSLIGVNAMHTANNVELHESFIDEKQIARMRSVDKIVVPARSSIFLKSGGMHIMLFGLKHLLKDGDTFEAEIIFDGIPPEHITVKVLSTPPAK